MKDRDRKKKKRLERLRREKHERKFGPSRPAAGKEDFWTYDGPDEEPDPPALQAFPRHVVSVSNYDMERSMRQMHAAMASQEFKSKEEFTAFMNTHFVGKKNPSFLDLNDPKERAQEVAYQALDTKEREKAIRLAHEAIALDPDCCDALTVLAHAEIPNLDERVARLEKAVAAGEKALGGLEFFNANRGHFWGQVTTRPYMRTMAALANALHDNGRIVDAILQWEKMLELNPGDNQGIRYSLIGAYLQADRLEDAAKLRKRFRNEQSGYFLWAEALEHFIAGRHVEASDALKKARKSNRFVEDFLLGEKEPPPPEPYYQPGAESEAVQIVVTQGTAWTEHPDSIAWLHMVP